MQNIILITSIIQTPNKPLSYIDIRSVYSHEERYEQTKKTIQTVKEKIPNSKILIVECSRLTEEQDLYFKEHTDYFLNLIDDQDKVNRIYSISKAWGEGTMTIAAFDFLKKNNVQYDSLFKISGRYWLTDFFNYNNFVNKDIIIHNIENNIHITFTCLYKLDVSNVDQFHDFLLNNQNRMENCEGYEILFSLFLHLPKDNKVVHLDRIGIKGYLSVSNDFIDM